MSENVGQMNVYSCDTCRGRIVTVNLVDGTTPMMLGCRATPGCRGTSYSHFYRVPPDLVPDHEWYRPTGREYARLSPAMREHVDLGGLAIRKIGASDPEARRPETGGGA